MFINADALFNVLMMLNVVAVLAAAAIVCVVLSLMGAVLARRDGRPARLGWPFYIAAGFLALLGGFAAFVLLA